MDVLTVRIDDNVSKKINSILKEFNYSTKTDFVRDAIRVKISQIEEQRQKTKALDALEKSFGSYKSNKTNKEIDILRRQAGEEFILDFEKKFKTK